MLLCALFSNIRANALIVEENALIYLLPPFWFLGLFEVMIGHHSLIFGTLARMAWTALAISCFVSVLSYTISYRSSMQKGFQSAGLAHYPFSGIRKLWTWILHKTLLKEPVERANFHFVAQTAFRRQEHMLYWGSFVAVGMAFVYLGLFVIKSGYLSDSSLHLNVLLSFPLIMSFFILVGLRFAFSVPADLNANWIFKIMDKRKLEMAYGGAHKFMLCAVMIPLLVIFVPCYLLIWGPGFVFLHIVYVAVLSLILIELLLFRFEKLPFSCMYLPGKANIKLWWPAYIIGCVVFSYETTVLERWILQDKIRYVVLIIIAGLIFIRLSRNRTLFLKRLDAIQFEEKQADRRIILHIEG
jgi:hypothetical protein